MTILIILLLFSIGKAQPINKFTNSFAVSTPEASALGKFADVPITYSNGTANVNIPIHTMSDGPLETNVSLNYHTGGIRLADMASWVGLGWSLNAGGMITRSVLGIPDDYHDYGQGYYYSGSILKNPFTQYLPDPPPPGSGYTYVQTQVSAASDGSMDSEPDMFTYNFGNYSGKFVFNSTQGIQYLPDNDIKIFPFFSTFEIVGFRAITPDGTIYTFGSKTYINNSYYGVERTTLPLANPVKNYNTTWYLAKIETPDKKFIINFEYTYDGQLMFYTNPVQQVFPYESCSTCTCIGCVAPECNSFTQTDWTYKSYKAENYYYAWRLKRIFSKTDTVRFNSNSNREDLPNADRLDEIVVKSANTSFCKKFALSYTYMLSSGSAVDNRKKRLILQSVQEKSCDNTIVNNPFLLSYSPGTLPERLDYGRDHWGYYNGSTTNDPGNYDGIPPNPIVDYNDQWVFPWADVS